MSHRLRAAWLVALVAGAMGLAAAGASAQTNRELAQYRLRVMREAKSLHEAAILLGGHVDRIVPGFHSAVPSLDRFVQDSAAIVRAVAAARSFSLSADGQTLFTDVALDVAERLHGDTPDRVVVRVVGGEWQFPDGATATMAYEGGSFEIGRTYVVFLREGQGCSPDATVANGPHSFCVSHVFGAFDVTDDARGVRQLMTYSSSAVNAPYNGWENGEFLRQVRVVAAGGKPEPPRAVRRVPDPPMRPVPGPRPPSERPPLPTASLDRAPTVGDASATRVVFEFCDLTWLSCASYAQRLPEVMKTLVQPGEIRYAFKFVVFENGPPGGFRVAQYAWCAHRQDKFWTMRDLMADHAGPYSEDDLVRYAAASAVEPKQFAECLDAESEIAIRAETTEARRLGVDTVPTLAVGELQADGSFQLRRRMTGIERAPSLVSPIRTLLR
jgi:hypothetical protein